MVTVDAGWESELIADSYFGPSDIKSDRRSENEAEDTDPEPTETPILKPTHEVPVFWHHAEEGSSMGRADFCELALEASRKDGVVCLAKDLEESWEVVQATPVLNVRLARIDTTGPSQAPRGIETLDLHALVDLHAELENSRKETPGELVVRGRVSSLAVAMLIDSGASVSIVSTRLWEHLHRLCPGWTLMPTTVDVCTVSGDLAKVRGQAVLEIELANRFYVHQFIVTDVTEDLILGMDFIHKHQVDCDWQRGVLRLRGQEVQAIRKYSASHGLCRRLIVSKTALVPAHLTVVMAKVAVPRPGDSTIDLPADTERDLLHSVHEVGSQFETSRGPDRGSMAGQFGYYRDDIKGLSGQYRAATLHNEPITTPSGHSGKLAMDVGLPNPVPTATSEKASQDEQVDSDPETAQIRVEPQVNPSGGDLGTPDPEESEASSVDELSSLASPSAADSIGDLSEDSAVAKVECPSETGKLSKASRPSEVGQSSKTHRDLAQSDLPLATASGGAVDSAGATKIRYSLTPQLPLVEVCSSAHHTIPTMSLAPGTSSLFGYYVGPPFVAKSLGLSSLLGQASGWIVLLWTCSASSRWPPDLDSSQTSWWWEMPLPLLVTLQFLVYVGRLFPH